MANIREILANNLKEYRRKCGLSQAKLAEKADITTQFIAMIEVSRKFPSPEMMDRLAKALDIEAYQLFTVPPSPEDAMERLHRDIVSDVRQVFDELIAKTLEEKCKK
jgi:transcriptional regulator with XRE-family HTH domain